MLTARVRRQMSRNLDVMALCEELERRTKDERTKEVPTEGVVEKSEGGFDKRAYQREYMRKRRAEGNAD